MKKLLVIAGLVLLAAGVWLGWQRWFPSPEQQIRQLLLAAVSAASWDESMPALERLAGAGRVASLCAEEVVVKMDYDGARTLEGRESVRGAMLAARRTTGGMRVSLGEMEVRVEEGGKAGRAQAVVIVQVPGAADPWVTEVRVDVERRGRSWRMVRVEPVRGFGG